MCSLNGANDKWNPCLTPFSIFAFPHTLLLPFLISVASPILLPLKLILTGRGILKSFVRSALSNTLSQSTNATYDGMFAPYIFSIIIPGRGIRRG